MLWDVFTKSDPYSILVTGLLNSALCYLYWVALCIYWQTAIWHSFLKTCDLHLCCLNWHCNSEFISVITKWVINSYQNQRCIIYSSLPNPNFIYILRNTSLKFVCNCHQNVYFFFADLIARRQPAKKRKRKAKSQASEMGRWQNFPESVSIFLLFYCPAMCLCSVFWAHNSEKLGKHHLVLE